MLNRSLSCRYLRWQTLFCSQALLFLSLNTASQLPAQSARAQENQTQSASQTAQRESASEIAAKIVAAYGGLDKLKDLRNLAYQSHGTHSVTSGVSGAANSLVCEIIGHGDKLRIETKMIGQPMILVFNGKESWTQFGDWVNQSTETTVKRIAEEMRHGLNLLAEISDPHRKLEYLGKKVVLGKVCDLLRVYADDGKPTTFYADQSGHLVIRSEFFGVDPEQGVPALQAVEYLDYRPAAGTFTPFKTVEYTGSKRTSETTLDKFEIGVTVDDKIFDMPAESEVARVKDGPVTIPFDYVANEIILKARIGRTDYRFIVDTGASQTVLDKSIAASVGNVSQSDFSITAGSKAVPLSYLTIPSISLGDLTLSNIPALVTDLASFSAAVGERPAGLIGANILRRFLVTIDFLDKKIVLSDPHKVTVPDGAVVLKTSPVFGATALVVSGNIDNKLNLNFLVDTGAGFSNLPQAAVRSLITGPVLPVGQIFGVDGKRLSISSVRFNSLKLGTFELPEPVFTLSPEGAAAGGASGLFTAGSMGILGNPIWSQFRTTIDYRNEKLILEPLPGRARFMSVSASLYRIDREYHKSRNTDQAIKSCQAVIREAHAQNDTGGEALGLAAMAEYYMEKGRAGQNSIWQSLASREYVRATALAKQSGNKEITGRVLAQWAGYYLSTSKGGSDLIAAKSLLRQALIAAPTEPTAYAWLGAVFLMGNQAALAEKTLDQALMLDPSNWHALWSEYRLYQAQNNQQMQQRVLAQLQRYYPNCPQVMTQSKQKGASTPGTRLAPVGTRGSARRGG